VQSITKWSEKIFMGKYGRGRRPPRRDSRRGNPTAQPGAGSGPLGLAPVERGANVFELVHPRCVLETELDYQEGLELWNAGDPDEARDALRYALEACHDNLWIHVALGRLALEESRDPVLARGHFGYAVELARRAIPAGFSGTLPPERPANVPFFQAVDGLLACLKALGKTPEADSLAALARKLGGSTAPW
jgi:tetratricopeptide (TPR) repeat protein